MGAIRDLWHVISQNPAPTTAIVAAVVGIGTLAVNLFIAQESSKHNITVEIMKRPGPMCEVYERLTFLIAAELLDDYGKPITKAMGEDTKCPPQKTN
jgi:hypothetical protein